MRGTAASIGITLTLFALALAVPALWFVHQQDPEVPVRIANVVTRVLQWALVVVAALVTLGLLAWPPFVPLVRKGFAGLRARIYMDEIELANALGRLKHLENAADLLVAGKILLEARRPLEAIPLLARAVELDPSASFLAARYRLALALVRAGFADKAIPHLEAVARHDPDHDAGLVWLRLAQAQATTAGGVERALRALDDFERSTGGTAESHWEKARLLRAQGQIAAARTALEQSLQARRVAGPRVTLDDRLAAARARFALWTWRRA